MTEWIDPHFLVLLRGAQHVNSPAHWEEEEDGSGDGGGECEEAPAPAPTPGQDGLGRWASFGADAEQAAARHGTAVAAELESAGLLRIESPGVYSFPMFTPAFCDLFLEELDNFYSTVSKYK